MNHFPLTYWFGYPLVVLGFIGAMYGICCEPRAGIFWLLALSYVLLFGGVGCFFHAFSRINANSEDVSVSGDDTVPTQGSENENTNHNEGPSVER